MSKEFLGVEYWQRHVDRCRHEGTSQAAYCRQHGLVLHQFGYWHRKLATQQTARWLPVEIEESAEVFSTIDLVLGRDRVVRLSEGFNAALLKQIIVAVEATP